MEIYIYRARGRQVYVTLVGPRFGVYVYFACARVLPMNGKKYTPNVSVEFSTPTVNASLVYMYSFCARMFACKRKRRQVSRSVCKISSVYSTINFGFLPDPYRPRA